MYLRASVCVCAHAEVHRGGGSRTERLVKAVNLAAPLISSSVRTAGGGGGGGEGGVVGVPGEPRGGGQTGGLKRGHQIGLPNDDPVSDRQLDTHIAHHTAPR